MDEGEGRGVLIFLFFFNQKRGKSFQKPPVDYPSDSNWPGLGHTKKLTTGVG